MKESYRIKPIGIIHCSFKTRDEITGSKMTEKIGEVELFREYEEGLSDIDGFSHIILVWWMHRSNYRNLKVKPLHFPEELRGVFATRHPDRPNPIGLTTVQLLERKGNILRVKGIDMIDGTPLIDIKPYLESDRKDDGRLGWLTGRNV